MRERRRTTRRCFVNLARCALEFLCLPGLNRSQGEKLVEQVGWDHCLKALELGRGVIIATAHFGNFDLMACVAALRGLPLHIITREQKLTSINHYWMSMRMGFGVGLIPAKDSIFRIHRLLKHNQVVAMVIDQHMPPGRGIAVPFFGQLASTTHAPALMAIATGAPILTASIERMPGGRHRLTIEPVPDVNRGRERNLEVVRLTTWLNRWLEEKIKQRPDHWLWIHRRWKLGPGIVRKNSNGYNQLARDRGSRSAAGGGGNAP